MSRGAGAAAVLLVAAALGTAAQDRPEMFTATAAVRSGGASASAPVVVTVTRYATDAERDAVKKALGDGGMAGLRSVLAKAPDAGFIELGERRTAVKFASLRSTEGGRLVTVVTAEPILFLGAGVPSAKPRAGYDLAIGIFDVKDAGGGVGDLSPAAKVRLDDGGALVVDDYGATVIWLNDIAVKK
jgi:hypothetical protein